MMPSSEGRKIKMTPERWKQVDRLLQAAFELEPNQIAPFLDSACADDIDLRKEIEKLLAADGCADRFIESQVLDGVSHASSPENIIAVLSGTKEEPTITAGDVLADRYQLITKLGKGGMGEVWHAYDLRLRVDVAMKSLRVNLRKNPEYVELLRKEVRSAREVISPHVCRIFDLVVVDADQEWISMEFIDGTTLSDLLGQSGPLDITKARDIAAQFLAGLEAIHQAGLVHRDLKPENIMITRTGRVVVMDFGISQEIAHIAGKVAGTLPYMSPEQISGAYIDGRSDIFAAGVTLAEMIHTKGSFSNKTRSMLWNALRVDVKRIPDSPWKTVIARAVALKPEERFQNVGALLRALEEVTEQIEGIDDQRPYPGLAAFTSANAEYFFGREFEVETIIKKMQQCPMLALIGPSGAGKTSFLCAGLLPALPRDWCVIFTTPGDAPILNLGESLSRSMGSTNQFEDPDNAVNRFVLLRQSYKEIVLIVDRFEELFTLNSAQVQARYCELIRRLAFDANVRVVLSMRDDYLFFCEAYDSLRLIFSDLTPIAPLRGAALRRALVEPALKCGYRFEDGKMLDFILTDVENERGALPLIAFAMARLWEKRDRKNGLITRHAYKDIGGMSGALAQYAEKIFEQMTAEKQSMVREIFRNLVTAQNTRVARDWDELLSAFPEKSCAEEVLRMLIDARLLTSFDANSSETTNRRRIEIVHESLLTAWPRLVRWQTQDAESAQMRDQLRQASQVWNERARSADLLWTGAAFLEYQAWRQRYAGHLSATEEAFGQAMIQHANSKRRRHQFSIAATFVILLSALTIITLLWRNASSARDKAVQQTRRAEGARVLAVARSLDKLDPSTKLAYALYSLEFADTPDARRYAMQAISEGPAYHAVEVEGIGVQISPDGKWIAEAEFGGGLKLVPQDGSKSITVQEIDSPPAYHIPWYSQFSPDSEYLLFTWRKNVSVIKVWSTSQKKIVRTFQFDGLTICFVRAGKAVFVTDNSGKITNPFLWRNSTIRVWNFGPEEPETLGQVDLQGSGWRSFDVDYQGRWIAYSKDESIFLHELTRKNSSILLTTDPSKTGVIRFNPNGKELATASGDGQIKLWSLENQFAQKQPLRTLDGRGGNLWNMWFDSDGSSLMVPGFIRWDLNAPLEADPLSWTEPGNEGNVDSKNRWLVVSGKNTVNVYHYLPQPSYTFRACGGSNVRFTPDGRSFITGHINNGISIHSLPGGISVPPRILWNNDYWEADSLDLDRTGRYVIAATNGSGLYLISTQDGVTRQLKGLSKFQQYFSVSFSPDGKNIAAVSENGSIEIWDVKKGTPRILEKSESLGAHSLKFSPDGTLFTDDKDGNLRTWNLSTNSSAIVVTTDDRSRIGSIAITPNASQIGIIKRIGNFSELVLFDLHTKKSTVISSHGNRLICLGFDRTGTKLVTGDAEGVVRVGPITGETPLMLLGNEASVKDISVDASGKWILSTAGKDVKLWRMPEGNEKPLQSFSTMEFQKAIREMTNVRIVADETQPIGYRTKLDPFTGWGEHK